MQNIRINVPSTFTVGISTDPAIMNNAAERLLRLQPGEIEDMAQEIIFGQLRLTVASLTIEQINQDRESFLESIRKNVEPELNKIGLYLINVNITDITDESAYIESIGKKAAAEAVNKAKVDVAEQDKIGAIGEAQANREKAIRVAENTAESEKGQKKAEADKRVFVQQQETIATIGEAEANRDKDDQGRRERRRSRKRARRRPRPTSASTCSSRKRRPSTGENKAKAEIADCQRPAGDQAGRGVCRRARSPSAWPRSEIQKAQYQAEQERLNAEEVVRAGDRETQDRDRRRGRGREDSAARRRARPTRILAKYEAEAKGIRQVLDSKAAGYESLVKSCNGDAKAASTLLMIEKIEEIVGQPGRGDQEPQDRQDHRLGFRRHGDGKGSSTANFLSSLIKSIPPLHDVAAMAGVELPEYLGKTGEKQGNDDVDDKTAAASLAPKPVKNPKDLGDSRRIP